MFSTPSVAAVKTADLIVSKSVTPPSGTDVKPGQVLTYTLTFTNTHGTAPAPVAYTDTLMGTTDDAAVTTTPKLAAGTGLTVTTDGTGDSFALTGINLGATAYSKATANTVDISTTAGAASALGLVTSAISQLASDRATVGANEERMTYTGDELGVLQDNLTAANSNITDVDVATESTNYASYQILVQSGVSMLAQANQNPQLALKLLQ